MYASSFSGAYLTCMLRGFVGYLERKWTTVRRVEAVCVVKGRKISARRSEPRKKVGKNEKVENEVDMGRVGWYCLPSTGKRAIRKRDEGTRRGWLKTAVERERDGRGWSILFTREILCDYDDAVDLFVDDGDECRVVFELIKKLTHGDGRVVYKNRRCIKRVDIQKVRLTVTRYSGTWTGRLAFSFEMRCEKKECRRSFFQIGPLDT